MGYLSHLRGQAGRVLGPVFGIFAIGYFAFHAVDGDRGVIALRDVRVAVDLQRAEAEVLHKKRMALEHRVALLHPDSLDRDMLDERARVMLNLKRENERVILLEE